MTAIQNKWADMSWFRRVLLILMLVEIVAFGIATAVTVGRWGLEYQGELLYPRTEGDVTWYEGRVDGKNAAFSVAPDGTVEYRWGEYAYGPYQVVEDPTAVPEEFQYSGTGVEIRRDDEVIFRGCRFSDMLFDKDGEPFWEIRAYGHVSDGTIVAEDGQTVSQEEYHAPGFSTLVQVVLEPELTHKGNVGLYLAVTFLALLNLVQILFPEALFKLSLLGRIRSIDIDDAEPSSFYIAMEHIEWVVLAGACLIFYAMALGEIWSS